MTEDQEMYLKAAAGLIGVLSVGWIVFCLIRDAVASGVRKANEAERRRRH